MNSDLFQAIVKKYPPLLNQQQYCELTGKSESTAEQDRIYGRGALFVRMGRRSIRYRLEDTIDFIDGLTSYKSTTEADYRERLENHNSALSN
ncbi:MAG: hypothetical protein C0399_10350 [Syntrophus sp. (in: bacteria)]|nr:hypothetical protein [Syntrophus sp. (in: bacteria)]